jgi:hypothetical protein
VATKRPKKAELKERIEKALECAMRYSQIDGSHHKMWCIDQIVRYLTGCPLEEREATDCRGNPYTYQALGESEEYQDFVAEACDGEDGPDTYSWDTGGPP